MPRFEFDGVLGDYLRQEVVLNLTSIKRDDIYNKFRDTNRTVVAEPE